MEDIEEPSLQELLTLERFAGAGAAVEFLVHSNCQYFLWVSHSLAQTKYATHSGLSTIKTNGISCMPSHFSSLREFDKLNALPSRGTRLGLNLGVDFKVKDYKDRMSHLPTVGGEWKSTYICPGRAAPS